jgi:hypothetical protein
LATYYTFEADLDYGIEVAAISDLWFYDAKIKQNRRMAYYPSRKIPPGPPYSVALADGASLFDFIFEETKEFVLVSSRAWSVIYKHRLADYWNVVPVKEVRLGNDAYFGYVIMQPGKALLSSSTVVFNKSKFWEIEAVDYEFELKDRMCGQKDWNSPLGHSEKIFDSTESYMEMAQNRKNPYFDVLFPKSLVVRNDVSQDAVVINNRFWVFSERLKSDIQKLGLTGISFVEIPIVIEAE